ncbi:MAG: GNAT family N-acetyltransferase [Patescibacteria group bacterium]
MNIILRRAKISDLVSIQALASELMQSHKAIDPLLEQNWYFEDHGKKYLLGNIRGRNQVCYVAVNEDAIIGYATGAVLKQESWRPIKRAELTNLIVTREYRNHGVGHLLIAAFKEWGVSKGAERFMVMTHDQNKAALKFYEDNGFKAHLITLESD